MFLVSHGYFKQLEILKKKAVVIESRHAVTYSDLFSFPKSIYAIIRIWQ